MKRVIISLVLTASFIVASAMDANAVVCARGVHRAGCVGAGGAVVVRHPGVVHPVVVGPRRAVVVRRRVY